MTYLFLIAAFNAIFFALLILQKKNALHDRILIVWLFYLGFYVGTYALFADRLFAAYPILAASFISLVMLHGPFMLLYVKALTNAEFKLRSILCNGQWAHFLPFLLFNGYLLIGSAMPGIAERLTLDHTHPAGEAPFLFNFFLVLTAISGPVYILLTIYSFRKLDVNIFNNFSTRENVDLDWLRKLVYSFGAIWTLFIIFATIHHIFHLFTWSFCTDGLFLSLSLFIILIGYFGLKQREIFVQKAGRKLEYVTEEKVKYSGLALRNEDADNHISRLKSFLETEKPYLEPGLTLPDLANSLDIPAHVLSRVINEKLGLNFFDLINGYRVEHVKTLLADPKNDHLSLLGMAFESGFNTKSAFNRVFKNRTGITPSEYKKNHYLL